MTIFIIHLFSVCHYLLMGSMPNACLFFYINDIKLVCFCYPLVFVVQGAILWLVSCQGKAIVHCSDYNNLFIISYYNVSYNYLLLRVVTIFVYNKFMAHILSVTQYLLIGYIYISSVFYFLCATIFTIFIFYCLEGVIMHCRVIFCVGNCQGNVTFIVFRGTDWHNCYITSNNNYNYALLGLLLVGCGNFYIIHVFNSSCTLLHIALLLCESLSHVDIVISMTHNIKTINTYSQYFKSLLLYNLVCNG